MTTQGGAAQALGPMGPATKRLCICTMAASALFAFSQRQVGFGTADLIFTVDGVLRLELWRLVTFPFVEADPISLIIGVVVGTYSSIFIASPVVYAIQYVRGKHLSPTDTGAGEGRYISKKKGKKGKAEAEA